MNSLTDVKQNSLTFLLKVYLTLESFTNGLFYITFITNHAIF